MPPRPQKHEMRLFLLLIVAGALALEEPGPTLEAAFPRLAKRVVYGADGREDARIRFENVSRAIVGFFYKSWTPGGVPYTSRYTRGGSCGGLCLSEPFFGNVTGPWCTGFLVAPDLVASAGHCTEEPSSLRFVFDFDDPSKRDYRDCVAVRRSVNSATEDYGLFELDRPVTDREPLRLSEGSLARGTKLLLVGHPMGLAVKADAGGTVKAVSNTLLAADMDAYAGNSGSPVLNLETREVVGILVMGNADYRRTAAGCCKSNVCPEDAGCGGYYELATRSTRFASLVTA